MPHACIAFLLLEIVSVVAVVIALQCAGAKARAKLAIVSTISNTAYTALASRNRTALAKLILTPTGWHHENYSPDTR